MAQGIVQPVPKYHLWTKRGVDMFGVIGVHIVHTGYYSGKTYLLSVN